MVSVGAKEKQQIYDAFENIYAVLKMFKKGDVPAPAQSGSVALVSQSENGYALQSTACPVHVCAAVCLFKIVMSGTSCVCILLCI